MAKQTSKYYSDALDAEQQIGMEEDIAALIFSRQEDTEDGTLGEQDCADLGREILKTVLREFRPDLFKA